MNSSELRALCAALGFTAVASKEGLAKGTAARARTLALLMEEFCRASVPDVFETKEHGAGKGDAAYGLWSASQKEGRTFIEAAELSGGRNVIAELRAGEKADQKALAAAIVAALNDSARKDALITELSACLEMCLASDQLDWTAEHDGELVLSRAKRGRAANNI